MINSFTYQFQQINELFKKGGRVLIASHENPDADALGSVLALRLISKELNRAHKDLCTPGNLETLCYLPDPPPGFFNFLPGFFEIKNKIPDDWRPNLLFCLDYGDFKRLNLPFYENAMNVVTIDHHRGDQRGEIKVVDPKISSTCEIIYWWLKENPPFSQKGRAPLDSKHLTGRDWIDKEIATCLLTGIVGDSGGFSHATTTFKTLKAASDLLTRGAPLAKITNQLFYFGSASPESTEIFGKVLSRIKTIPECGLAYSWLSAKDLKNQSLPLSGLNGIPSLIAKESTANFALFLVEYEKGQVKGSLRSEPFKGQRVDLIAQKLGGGGHPYAAGFRQEGTVEEVLKKVIELIKCNRQENFNKPKLI